MGAAVKGRGTKSFEIELPRRRDLVPVSLGFTPEEHAEVVALFRAYAHGEKKMWLGLSGFEHALCPYMVITAL